MELLERHFDMALESPDGINKLRELILTLAMQGRLVPQDSNDSPARELLKEIQARKSRLVKERKIKQTRPLQHVTLDERPFDLPNGWEWVRLGEIGTWKSGSTPSRAEKDYYGGNIPWVKSGEVKQGRITQTEETITEAALRKCSLPLNPVGSVLVAMYGANIGEVGILEIEATTNQAVCACQTYSAVDKRFLLAMLHSLKRNFLSQGAGAAQPNISREKIIATIAPLPPLPEQVRIVARIDELMARCDEWEKLRAQRDVHRLAVHAAAIRKLLNVYDADVFVAVLMVESQCRRRMVVNFPPFAAIISRSTFRP
jgi:restriction endonuclease S subunit